MKKNRRLLALAMTLLLAISFTVGMVASAEEKTYDKPIEISMTVLDAEKTGNTARDKWLFEKFNITFNYIPVTWGDWFEKVRVMTASDDIPDILWWDMKINHTSEFRGWAENGAFREIGDLSKWPNMLALRDKLTSDDKMLSVDGKLYGWPTYRNNPDWLQNAYYPMFAYRRDWAKEVGLYKEGDVYTYDEVFAMIDAVIAQDPGGNGEGNTIGIASEAWAFPTVFMETLGYSKERSGYVKTDDGYVPYFTTDGWRNELKFVADMYRKGYIWKDQIVVGGSEGMDNFKAGRSFMYLGNSSPDWFSGQYAAWLETGAITSTDDLAPMVVLSPNDNKTFTLTQTEDYWTVANIAYHVDDEKYERIMDLWDWLLTEDGRAYKVAGIPDVDYKRISDSEIEILWEKNAEGVWLTPYRDTANNFVTPPALVPSPNEGSVMTGFEAFAGVFDFIQNSPDYWVTPLNWELSTFDGTLYSQFGAFDTESKEFIITVLASSEDVDMMIDNWLKEMEPKWRPVADELNANL